MANTVETLKAIFENNECKLDVIMCKLEDYFAKYQSDQHPSLPGDQQAMNPVKIMNDLKSVKEELAQVKKSYLDLQEYQKEMNKELESEYATIQQDVDKFLQSFNK